MQCGLLHSPQDEPPWPFLAATMEAPARTTGKGAAEAAPEPGTQKPTVRLFPLCICSSQRSAGSMACRARGAFCILEHASQM